MSTVPLTSAQPRGRQWHDVRPVAAAALPVAQGHELTNALYSAPGVRARSYIWYWQLGAPSNIQEWVTLAAHDARIEVALDGDAIGLDVMPLDWRTYAGDTQLLAWTACHEPIIELLRAVFRCDWVPEHIGDCDPPARSSSVRAGFSVFRDDGALVVNGLVNLAASAVRGLATAGACAVARHERLLRSVLTRLPLVLDEFDMMPTELTSLIAGAVVRLDNRTLSQRVARLTVPVGHARLVVDVTDVHATVAGLISNPIGGDTMSDAPAPADTTSPGMQTPAPSVQIGAVPVRLMFSAGRLTLPFGALADIGPGYVFGLDKRLDDRTITMYANDVPVAVGELVTIGDLVGVRLTRMLPKA